MPLKRTLSQEAPDASLAARRSSHTPMLSKKARFEEPLTNREIRII
jgi:hypothetical protein